MICNILSNYVTKIDGLFYCMVDKKVMSETKTSAEILEKITQELTNEIPYTRTEKICYSLYTIIPIIVYVALMATYFNTENKYYYSLCFNMLLLAWSQFSYYTNRINFNTMSSTLGISELALLLVFIFTGGFATMDNWRLANLSQLCIIVANNNLTHIFNNKPGHNRAFRFGLKFICSMILCGYSYLIMHYLIQYQQTNDKYYENVAIVIGALSPFIVGSSVILLYVMAGSIILMIKYVNE